MTKPQLEQANQILDKTCQDLEFEKAQLLKETQILKSIISLMMTSSECTSKVVKLQTPKPMHIKINNDYCTITMIEGD